MSAKSFRTVAQLTMYLQSLPLNSTTRIHRRMLPFSLKKDHCVAALRWTSKKVTILHFARVFSLCFSFAPLFSVFIHDVPVVVLFFRCLSRWYLARLALLPARGLGVSQRQTTVSFTNKFKKVSFYREHGWRSGNASLC